MATSMMQQISDPLAAQQQLPTKWQPPKKPAYRESILDHKDIKTAMLRHNNQPFLPRLEAERKRNTYKKELCVEMLKEGFHNSFRELDLILKLQISERHRVGSEHPVWERPLLHQEDFKLEYLCRKLRLAESAQRKTDVKALYSNYYDLANFFILTDDSWLSDYFFNKCLSITETGGEASNLDKQREAEAQCNLGFSYEKQRSFFKAMEHYERYYALTQGTRWTMRVSLDDLDADSMVKLAEMKRSTIERDLLDIQYDTMFEDACMHLQRIYKTVANRYAKDHDEKLEYLKKVYEVSKSSGIAKLEGQASFMLGKAYEEAGDMQTALQCYTKFYELSKKDTDSESYGQAAEACAKCHQRMGQVDKSIQYLEKYLKEVSSLKRGGEQYSRACGSLANIYNALGKYDMATEFSRKAFEASREAGHTTGAVDFNRVLFGIAKAHKNLQLFNKNVELATRHTLTNLLNWKYNENRELVLQDLSSGEN